MPKFLCRARSWRMSEAGVIGYALRKSGSFDCTLAAISPSASAWLPVTFRYVPGGSCAGATSYCVAKPSLVSPNA